MRGRAGLKRRMSVYTSVNIPMAARRNLGKYASIPQAKSQRVFFKEMTSEKKIPHSGH